MRMRIKKHGAERLAACKNLLLDRPAAPFASSCDVIGEDLPLWLEIGCGKGDFACGMAEKHPDVCFVALERISNVMVNAVEKAAARAAARPDRLRFAVADAATLDEWFAPKSLDAIYLNFSDPWPKKGHVKRRLTHRAFLHLDNIYHSPYVLQYWSDIRGRDIIGELFREGRNGEDALMTYKRLFGLNQLQMCDEMFEACRHIVGLDYRHAWNETRQYAGQIDTPTDIDPQGWTCPKQEFTPEDYGFNVFPISLNTYRGTITLSFEGLANRVGWRYGIVAEKADGHYDYSTIGYKARGTLRYTLPAGTRRAWVVVMGAPSVHTPLNPSEPSEPLLTLQNSSEPILPTVWPYRFKLR